MSIYFLLHASTPFVRTHTHTVGVLRTRAQPWPQRLLLAAWSTTAPTTGQREPFCHWPRMLGRHWPGSATWGLPPGLGRRAGEQHSSSHPLTLAYFHFKE